MSKALAPKTPRRVKLSEAGWVRGRLMERAGRGDNRETGIFGVAFNLYQNDEAEP